MPTSAYSKFQSFVLRLGEGVHQLHAAGHQLEVYLSNTTPNLATHNVKADLAEITNQNGYTAPVDTQNGYTASAGTGTLVGTSFTLTSSGAGFGPFRYVVLFNTTPTSPADPLIGHWDYGSAITPAGGETFEVRFNGVASGSPGTIFTLT